jgi:hypothetical protein
MSKKKPKEYRIDSFERLINVATPENVDRLAVDLCIWLKYHIAVVEKLKEMNHELKDLPNYHVAPGHMIWVDDGKHDHLNTIVTDPNTGEVREYNTKK